MRRFLDLPFLPFAAATIFAIVIGVTACGDSDPDSDRPECDKKCQGENDVFLPPGSYTDYFVSEGGDKKDGIVAVYTGIPSGIEGVTCSVFKNFDDGDAVAMFGVCPGAIVFNGSQTQDFPEEE